MGRGSPPAYFTVSEGFPGAEIPHEGADAGVFQDRLIQIDPTRIRAAEDLLSFPTFAKLLTGGTQGVPHYLQLFHDTHLFIKRQRRQPRAALGFGAEEFFAGEGFHQI